MEQQMRALIETTLLKHGHLIDKELKLQLREVLMQTLDKDYTKSDTNSVIEQVNKELSKDAFACWAFKHFSFLTGSALKLPANTDYGIAKCAWYAALEANDDK